MQVTVDDCFHRAEASTLDDQVLVVLGLICMLMVQSICTFFTCWFFLLSTVDSRFPLATFHDVRHNVLHMDFDVTRSLLLTTGNDRVMKVIGVGLSN